MKRLLLSAALIAFAGFAAQADDSNAKAPATGACCAKTKATTQTSASCPMATAACCSKEKQTAAKKTVVKQALLSPKAAASL
jgi:hypothetical protein